MAWWSPSQNLNPGSLSCKIPVSVLGSKKGRLFSRFCCTALTLPCGTVHVGIRPLLPLHRTNKGNTVSKLKFYTIIFSLHTAPVGTCLYRGYRCGSGRGRIGARSVRFFLTHIRANLVPVSTLALLKCDFTKANGVSLQRWHGTYMYMDCITREILRNNILLALVPSKQTTPFFHPKCWSWFFAVLKNQDA